MTLFVGGGSEGGREGRGEHPWDQSTPPALCPCHQPHPHARPRPAYLMDDNDSMAEILPLEAHSLPCSSVAAAATVGSSH
jgi:hypothetical protein